MPTRNPVAHALNHETRKLMVEVLWHHHEPLTAEQFHREYIEDGRASLSQIAYHVRQLAETGIVKVEISSDRDEFARCPFVLSGPYAGEAIRRLALAG
jgi:DNA-binding transcriptional ArsR family regulator